jgi:hypothetical protein
MKPDLSSPIELRKTKSVARIITNDEIKALISAVNKEEWDKPRRK